MQPKSKFPLEVICMSKDKKSRYGSVYVPEKSQENSKKTGSIGSNAKKIEELETIIDQLKESIVKSNRDILDALYNVDEGNFSPSFLKLIP